MKKLQAVLFLLLFISVLPSTAGQIDFNSTGKSHSIIISDLASKIEKKGDQYSVKLIDNYYSELSFNTNYNIDELRFQLTLPENFEIKLEILKSKLIGNYHLRVKDDSPSISAGSIEPFVTQSYLGIQRGLKVYQISFNPFTYNTNNEELSLITDAVISINYQNEIQNKILFSESGFYSNISNLNLAGKIDNKQRTSDRTLASGWYDNNKLYLRLATKDDAIARIQTSALTDRLNEFKNKNLEYFHLYYRGEEQSIYFRSDFDGLMNEGDELIFFGKSESGDTTKYDNYEAEASFYLFYDESSSGKRYSLYQGPNDGKILNRVKISKHFEKDLLYAVGFPQDNIENMPGEGWQWSLLSPSGGGGTEKEFITPIVINPTFDTGDSIEVKVSYASERWDPFTSPSHRLSFHFNGDSISSLIMNARDKGEFTHKGSSLDFLSGTNQVRINALGNIKSDKLILPDETVIDYIKIEAYSSPFALNGSEEFDIETSSEDIKLKVPGFNSNEIVWIDNINNYINFPNVEKGIYLQLSTRSGENPITSMRINGNETADQSFEGIQISVLLSPDLTSPDHKTFKADADGCDQAKNFLNSVPTNSLIVVSVNSDEYELASGFRQSLASLGSNLINSVNVSDSYIFSSIKGDNQSVNEKLNKIGIAGLSRFISNNSGNSFEAEIGLSSNKNYSLVINDAGKIQIPSIKMVSHSDLLNSANAADYLIITDSLFFGSAVKLQNHRKRTHPEIKSMIVFAEDIYKEFSFGKKSPHAIRNFLKYTYKNWQKPAPMNLVLIGDASYDGKKILSSSKNTDFIPTFGWPASDYWYVMLEGDDLLPEMIIGRIPAVSNKQASAYVDKVIEHDTMPNDPWTKMCLYLSGGIDDGERFAMYDMVNGTFLQDNLYPSDVCPDSTVIRKRDPNIGGETEANRIISKINEGAYWVAFYGHGSPTVFDMDGWQSDKLNNKGKYGFFSTISCNTADFANTQISSRNEDYVLEPGKGFVGAGGSSNFSLKDAATALHQRQLKGMMNPDYKYKTYAELLNLAKNQTLTGEGDRFISLQYCYLGDPLIKLRNVGPQDLYLPSDPKFFSYKSNTGNSIITEEDSILRIEGSAYNAGYRYFGDMKIKMIHDYEGNSDTSYFNFNGLCRKVKYNFVTSIKNKPGMHRIYLEIDPDSVVADPIRKNNSISLTLQIYTAGLYPVDPLAYWDVNHFKNETYRFINPIHRNSDDQFKYNFALYLRDSLIHKSVDSEIEINPDYIDWKPKNPPFEPNASYSVHATMTNLISGKQSSVLRIPFNLFTNKTAEQVRWGVFGEDAFKELELMNLEIRIDFDSHSLYLTSKDFPYYLLSVRSNQTHSPFRASEIDYNNSIYFTSVGDILGFKVVHISSDDYKVKNTKAFNTWGDALDPLSDSASIKLVEFLKDSIPDKDYLLLTVHGESFRLPQVFKDYKPESIGSIDSLRNVLKMYGSKIADSLAWGYSYLMIGKKNDESFNVIEGFDKNGDSVSIKGFLTQKSTSGYALTSKIGPSKGWSNALIRGEFFKDSSTKIEVRGINTEGKESLLLTIPFDNDTVDLSSIDAVKYPYIRLKSYISLAQGNIIPKISSIQCIFQPVEEFVVSKNSTFTLQDTILRGDTAHLTVGYQNISLRTRSDSNIVSVKSVSDLGENNPHSFIINPLPINSINSSTDEIATEEIAGKNTVTYTINKDMNIAELYSFNNFASGSFYVLEDIEKPDTRLFFDSVEVAENDYVAVKPEIMIRIYDNSRLPINKVTKVEVLINGKWQTQDSFNFVSYERDVPLKAEVTFNPDSLEYGQNVIRLYTSDASGNRDTLKRSVMVSRNWFVENQNAYPNPMSGQGRIEFYLKAPEASPEANIDIYNVLGQKVAVYKLRTSVGRNQLTIESRDEFGNSLPSGVYTYIIRVQTSDFIEPVTGKLLFVE